MPDAPDEDDEADVVYEMDPDQDATSPKSQRMIEKISPIMDKTLGTRDHRYSKHIELSIRVSPRTFVRLTNWATYRALTPREFLGSILLSTLDALDAEENMRQKGADEYVERITKDALMIEDARRRAEADGLGERTEAPGQGTAERGREDAGE